MVLMIVQSLGRRFPPQQDLIMIVTQFFKMMTLHPLGLEMLFEHEMIESFIGLARDA